MLKIKEIPKEERPRERLKEVGVNNLSNKELLHDTSNALAESLLKDKILEIEPYLEKNAI